jgi:thymidine kinase
MATSVFAAAAAAAAPDAAGPADADASFDFFLGPMFSGKTSSVWRALERARLAGLPCVLVRHAADTRTGPGAEDGRTHGGIPLRSSGDPPGTPPASGGGSGGGGDGPGLGLAPLRVVAASRLAEVRLAPGEQVVGIDEGQFFDDLADAVAAWLAAGRRVFVAALDGDFRRRPFPSVCAALPLATGVTKLRAVCMLCPRAGPRGGRLPRPASYTVRLATAPRVAGSRAVGGAEAYRAACGHCYVAAAAAAAGGRAGWAVHQFEGPPADGTQQRSSTSSASPASSPVRPSPCPTPNASTE